ncbi:hypothetical protein ES705_34109 [subsurface metagenome]
MKSSKFTLKTQYVGDVIKFNIKFDFPLSKQEIKKFRNIFLEKRDVNKEKLDQYKKAIDRFSSNRKEFTRLLAKSEAEYKRLPFKDTSENSFNRNLKKEFVNNQWKVYNKVFTRNPRFREIVSKIVESHLEQEHSIKIMEFHEYSLRDDLLLLIRDKKYLIKSIKEREDGFKKELLEKIKGWENTQAFFPSICKGCDIVASNFTIDIVFNVKTFYESIFNYFFKYYNIGRRLKEPIVISKDMSYLSGTINPFFIIGISNILEEQNSALRNYGKLPFTHTKIKDKFLFRFNFEEVIKGICTGFNNEREIWVTPVISSPQLKEKVLQKVKLTLPIAVIIIIIFVSISLFLNIPTVNVEKYDSVKIDYTVWESDEAENYDALSPVADLVLWVTMIPITENDSIGLMLGLYNNMLGKKINFNSGLVWLNKCIDQNRDGIDDSTGQPALTYGNSTDQYFNTCLMIRFKILDIEKYSPSASLDPKKNIVLYILGYIGVSIAGLLILILAFFYGHRYIQKRKLRPKLFIKRPTTKRLKLVKYGLLAALLPTIGVITMSIVNAVTPFSEILLSNKYNPFALPVVIGFIITVCVLSIPIYFVIFGYVHRKIQKKRKTDT